jgi:flagellar basal-body rod protein FlgF
MDRLIHTSLSAMRANMARQAVTANNLANASTTGFRAEISSARPLWIDGQGLPDRAVASQEVQSADMRAAATVSTGRALDIAMNGDAMLTVQAENGDEAYTRRGDLMVSAAGLLTTGDGHPVLGEGGPVTVPPSDQIRIDSDCTLWVIPAGGDANAPQKIDRLKLATPVGSDIVKHVDGLFRVRGGGALPNDPTATVTGGALEGSNVNATSALVDMIEAARSWDTQIKLITTARDLDTETASLMRLPS